MSLSRKALAYGLAAVVLLLAVLTVLRFFGGIMDALPWSDKSRLERTQADLATARSEATANGLEAAGEREIGRSVETHHTREIIIRDATATAVANARSAPDANSPMGDARLSRLRNADDRLCEQYPASCGPAPAVASPGGD